MAVTCMLGKVFITLVTKGKCISLHNYGTDILHTIKDSIIDIYKEQAYATIKQYPNINYISDYYYNMEG